MSRLNTFVSGSAEKDCAASHYHIMQFVQDRKQNPIEGIYCANCGGCLFDRLEREEILAKCLD